MVLQAHQQRDVNSAGHTVTDGEKKSEGLVTAALASAVRVNNTPRSIKELPFSHFPSLNEGWRTAKPGSDKTPNMICLCKAKGVELTLPRPNHKVQGVELTLPRPNHKVQGVKLTLPRPNHKVQGVKLTLLGASHKVQGVKLTLLGPNHKVLIEAWTVVL